MHRLEPPLYLEPSRSIILSAGPGAGKTALLRRWQEASPSTTCYAALTSDDASVDFFLHRLLMPWPDIREHLEQLRRELPGSEPGSLLGLALTAEAPSFCLLLDNFHLCEGTPLEPLLMGLIRQFPPAGSLAIASRHRPPRLERPGLEVWDADHPFWREKVTPDDWQALPAALQEQALALHVVGEFATLPDGGELVRRNLAQRGASGLLVLRPSWHEAVDQALTPGGPARVWALVAAGIEAHGLRHFQTYRGLAGRQLLGKVPPEVRQKHAYLLRLEGGMLLEGGNLEGGWENYRLALASSADQPQVRLDTLLEMATGASIQRDLERFHALMGEIAPHRDGLTSAQRARFLNLQAWAQWLKADTEAVQALWQQVLAIPPLGDRTVAYEHHLALLGLHVTHNNQGLRLEATRYAERLLTVVTEHDFDRVLLDAHNARLRCLLLDPEGPCPIQTVLEIPLHAFQAPSPEAVLNFLSLLGSRALRAQAHRAAYAYFQYMRTLSIRYGVSAFLQMSNLHLLEVACFQGRFVEAQVFYDELMRHPLDNDQRNLARLTWSWALAKQGKKDAAQQLLSEEVETQSLAELKEHAQSLLRAISGKPIEAPPVLSRQSLRKSFWQEALKGLTWPSKVACEAFGDLTLTLDGIANLQLTRHKALGLLGHLVLNPDGVPSEALAEHLFGDPTELNLLHSAAHSLRQGFKKMGIGNLLEAAGGMYRLRWSDVAFCDLHEFDALYRKARDLENGGYSQGARLFYGLACSIAPAPLFNNLPDGFDSARAAYAAKLRHAREQVERMTS